MLISGPGLLGTYDRCFEGPQPSELLLLSLFRGEKHIVSAGIFVFRKVESIALSITFRACDRSAMGR